MSEFHVTPEAALNRIEAVRESGEFLGLDGSFVDTDVYAPGSRDDFENYLFDFGIEFFTIDEVVTPHKKSKAKQAGFTELVPPLHLWPWSLLVLRVGDLMRDHVGNSIRIRNLYRPMSYNRLVATSGIKSDHPNACSGDFDFSSTDDRRAAEQLVRELSRDHPGLEISLGLGGKTLHVGIMSPKGKRHWFYKSYKDKRVGLQ